MGRRPPSVACSPWSLEGGTWFPPLGARRVGAAGGQRTGSPWTDGSPGRTGTAAVLIAPCLMLFSERLLPVPAPAVWEAATLLLSALSSAAGLGPGPLPPVPAGLHGADASARGAGRRGRPWPLESSPSPEERVHPAPSGRGRGTGNPWPRPSRAGRGPRDTHIFSSCGILT